MRDAVQPGARARRVIGQRRPGSRRQLPGTYLPFPAPSHYEWFPLKGKVTAFNTDDLKKNEFYFYWIVPGSYHVTVMATDPETGQAYPATADFEVQAPAVRLFAARTRKVSVLHAKAGGHVFAFGGKEACDSGNGILWNYRVQAPSAAGGRIGMTQILTDELRHDGVACTIATKKNGKVVNSYPADGTTEALDGAFWYDHADEVAAGATTPTLDQVDFPHTPLTNKGLWSADFRASDWLMFLPQGPDSIPVALRLMRW